MRQELIVANINQIVRIALLVSLITALRSFVDGGVTGKRGGVWVKKDVTKD